jgi:hypothetical protein
MGADPQKANRRVRKRTKDNSPSTCFFFASRAWRASSAACHRLRTVSSCSSRDWSKFASVTLSWTSSPLSLETSSSRCLRVARATSSAVRSCWSRPSASLCARRSRSRATRASTRAAHSCWS